MFTKKTLKTFGSAIISTVLLLAPVTTYAAPLYVQQGGTGSSTLSGILVGNGLSGLSAGINTLLIGTGLLFNGTTLSTNGTAASSTLLSDTNTFSGQNTFSNNVFLSTLSNGLIGIGGNKLYSFASTSLFGYIPEQGLTFNYPIQRTSNTVSLAFGTTTSNLWAGTQTFTNAPIFSSLSGLLKGNGAGALTVASNGTDYTLITAKTCPGSDFVSAVTAGGVFTCTTPAGTTYTGTYPIQVSGLVISSAFGTTTNTGISSGNLYVGSGGILQTSASSTIFGFTPASNATTITIAGTANQLTSSAGAQDLSANRVWTLSLPSHVIFPGNFQVTNSTTTNATTTGSVYLTGVTASKILQIDATGKVIPLTIGTGLSFDGTTLSSTGTTYTGTYPIQITGSVISLAFGTSTSNTWGGTQTFTNAPVVTAFTGGSVAVGATGLLYNSATSTETCTGPLSCTSFDVLKNGGAITIAKATTAVDGYLGATDFTIFNNKISSTSLSSANAGLTYNSGTGVFTIATSSLYSGTTGQFPYFSGTNTITATSSLFIASSGNIGIGTTSPASLFSVQGNALFSGTVSTANLTATGTVTLAGISGSTQCLQVNSSGVVSGTGAVCGSGGGGGITIETPIGTINGSNTVFSAVNNPAQVYVNGQFMTGGGVDYTLTGAGPYTITFVTAPPTGSTLRSFYTGTQSGAVNSGTQGQIAWYGSTGNTVSGTSTLTISQATNVGIGTSTPAAKFDLNGYGILEAIVEPTVTYLGSFAYTSTHNVFQWWSGIWNYGTSNAYSTTADQTINTISDVSALTASTYIGTTTMPTNYMKAGKKFTVTGWGVYSTPIANTSTITIKIKFGATTVATVTTGALPASATNLPFMFIADCTVRSVGASGTIICDGMFDYSTALTGIVKTTNAIISNSVTIDTTAQSVIDVTGAWSAVTTQTATVQQASLDFKN